VQLPPSGEPVQGAQIAGSLVHTIPPMPSETHPQPQQSAAAVHVMPSATHALPHRRTPLASGTQMPPQHVSAKSHSAPSGRQHTIAPPRPVAHVMSGYVSMQHSDVIVHSAPGSVHTPSPPRQRLTPVLAGRHPVSPPPFGQQFVVAPPPPHTSPAGMHEPVFAQRMIGRPSVAVPAAAHPPEQHSASLRHGSSWRRQPPSGWHVAVPVPDASRQAVEQHAPLKPSVPQGSPATRQEPADAHTPTVAPPGREQTPMQH
jgi:hypothetical protein